MNPITEKTASPLKGRKLSPEFKAKLRAIALSKTPPLEVRFWAKVEKTDTCWIWKGAKRHWGYGCIWVDGRIEVAHRVAWKLAGRELPPPHLCLDHMCRTPACVRPDHLRVVTYQQNAVENNSSPFAQNFRLEQCKYGHPFTPENTAMMPPRKFFNKRFGKWQSHVGSRVCLTCYPSQWRNAVIPRPRPLGSKYLRTDADYDQRKKPKVSSTGGSS